MPDIIRRELNNLREKCNAGMQDALNWYASIFAIKDSYEILVKYSCLTAASLSFNNGEDSIFKIFTDPERSMSFGDWTISVIKAVRDSEFVKHDATLSAYFVALSELVNDTDIVAWRNDTIGHGAAKFVIDEDMITDIIRKKDRIFAFVSQQNSALTFIAECNDKIHCEDREPFILWEGKKGIDEGGIDEKVANNAKVAKPADVSTNESNSDLDNMHVLLFDSMDRSGRCKYLDLTSRGRVTRVVHIFKDKRRKFYGNLNVVDINTVNMYGYDSTLDATLAAFHQTGSYVKPSYLKACVQNWLKAYSSGTFLIYSGRGTGKSSFVYACDELQHDKGEQKIKLSYDDKKVAVRAYYANRTEMLAPDEAEQFILETLKTTPDDEQIRLRGISSEKFIKMSFAEKVAEYYKYYRTTGIDKLIVFIDGLDELNDAKADILKCIPNGTDVADGIYFICMCRSREEGIPAIVSSYCNAIDFTDTKDYDRTKENAFVLKDYLKAKLKLEESDALSLCKKLDYRFSMVALLESMRTEEIKALITSSVKLDDKYVLAGYLENLKRCYGDAYFKRMLRIAIIIANTPGEALELQEISWLAEGRALSTREIAFLHDLRPLLMEFRDYRGAVYGMSSRTWVDALNELHPQVLKDIADEWLNDLMEMDTSAPYCEEEWLAYLYKASTIAFYLVNEKLKADKAKHLMHNVTYVAVRFQQGYQQHITFRSMRCFNTLFNTYYQQLDISFDRDVMRDFVAVFNNCSKQYANLHMEKQILIMVDEINLIIDRYYDEIEDDFVICWQVISFYSNMICICGDLYNFTAGEEYYKKVVTLYSVAIAKYPDRRDELQKLYESASHNEASLIRFINPDEALHIIENLLPDMRKWERGYDDLNTGYAAAMCYLSAGKSIEGYDIFKECFEQLKKLPAPKNSHENEIYIVIAWRYCDSVAEYYDLCDSPMSELENAVITMNQVLDYVVYTEQNGFSDLSGWKPQMVMTAAKIQGKLAEIKSKSAGITAEAEEHLSKAVEIVEKVPEIYDEWDKIGLEYDRLAAMRNFINVGAVYVEAFQIDKGIEVLKGALERFSPENEVEKKERELIRQKIEEFKGYASEHREPS